MTHAQVVRDRSDVPDETTETRLLSGLSLKGRFMLPDRSEHACTIRAAGLHAIVIETEVLPERDTPIVLYVEDLGRLEGRVTDTDAPESPEASPADATERADSGEDSRTFRFTLEPSLTPKRRERLEQSLEWLEDKMKGKAKERRRHLRIAPRDGQSRIVLADGRSYPCEVLDISLSGASVRMPVLPALGTHVTLGRMRGRVVRHHETGIAIEFVRTADPQTLHQTVRKL